ncbi:Vesicle-associated membrane protein-associated protein [Dirofilaria immitis]
MDRKLTVQPTMVTFSAPLTEHQTVDLDIKNDWNKTIIFKMKTTRPDAFKMKPVYGLVEAGEKKKVILTLKKWDPNKKPKKNDHFTVVMAPAPDKCNNPIKTWKSWKESKRSEASIGACRRQVKITYKGIALKEIKKKSPKDELAKAPIVKAEEIEEKKEEKIEAVKEERKADEDEKSFDHVTKEQRINRVGTRTLLYLNKVMNLLYSCQQILGLIMKRKQLFAAKIQKNLSFKNNDKPILIINGIPGEFKSFDTFEI